MEQNSIKISCWAAVAAAAIEHLDHHRRRHLLVLLVVAAAAIPDVAAVHCADPVPAVAPVVAAAAGHKPPEGLQRALAGDGTMWRQGRTLSIVGVVLLQVLLVLILVARLVGRGTLGLLSSSSGVGPLRAIISSLLLVLLGPAVVLRLLSICCRLLPVAILSISILSIGAIRARAVAVSIRGAARPLILLNTYSVNRNALTPKGLPARQAGQFHAERIRPLGRCR